MEKNEANQAESPREPSTIPTGPARLSKTLAKIETRLDSPRLQAEVDRRTDEDRQAEAEKLAAEIAERRKRLWKSRGRRYSGCTLENFEVSMPQQELVIKQLRAYRGRLAERVAAGVGIALSGPTRTGKDHLIASLFEPALEAGLTIQWTSGAKLFIRFRDRIGSEADERRMIREYTEPDVLALSDPMPIFGALTGYQAQILYEIADTRANAMKPTWVTINVNDQREADERLGPQIVRRLCEDALSLACHWPSYRRAKPR